MVLSGQKDGKHAYQRGGFVNLEIEDRSLPDQAADTRGELRIRGPPTGELPQGLGGVFDAMKPGARPFHGVFNRVSEGQVALDQEVEDGLKVATGAFRQLNPVRQGLPSLRRSCAWSARGPRQD